MWNVALHLGAPPGRCLLRAQVTQVDQLMLICATTRVKVWFSPKFPLLSLRLPPGKQRQWKEPVFLYYFSIFFQNSGAGIVSLSFLLSFCLHTIRVIWLLSGSHSGALCGFNVYIQVPFILLCTWRNVWQNTFFGRFRSHHTETLSFSVTKPNVVFTSAPIFSSLPPVLSY
jgi:hypothetical protein